LLELIQTKVSYVVQEAIVVIRDIFRKYPNRYESVIGMLCENLESLEEPEAKSALIWVIGQYAERIDNAQELLESFVEEFDQADPDVKLQLLTASVKLFLKRPDRGQALVKQVINCALLFNEQHLMMACFETPHGSDASYRGRFWASRRQAARTLIFGTGVTFIGASFHQTLRRQRSLSCLSQGWASRTTASVSMPICSRTSSRRQDLSPQPQIPKHPHDVKAGPFNH